MVRTLTLVFLALSVALSVACGSGGSDSGTITSSSASSGGSSGGSSGLTSSSGGSSGGSSGLDNCGATCQSSARLTFDESNASGRLEGAIVEACRRSSCAQGRLMKSDAGAGYQLSLQSKNDAGPLGVYASVQPSPTAGSLRFTVDWQLDYSGPNAPVDGDAYTVSARVSEDGQELFARSFTATYKTVTVCGTVCKEYSQGP